MKYKLRPSMDFMGWTPQCVETLTLKHNPPLTKKNDLLVTFFFISSLLLLENGKTTAYEITMLSLFLWRGGEELE
jgi:hypothetical protein